MKAKVEEMNEVAIAAKAQHYEMLYIIPVKYTVEELPQINQKVKALLAEHGCQVTYEEDLGKKKLSYPIKHVFHGYYFVTEFNMSPQELTALNHSLRLAPEVLRHLILVKHERTAAEIEKEKTRRARAEVEEVAALKEKIEAQATPVTTEKVEEAKETIKGKVSIEDLDKKLDELIDESIL